MGCIQAGSGGRHEEGCAVQQIRRLAIVNRTEAAMRALTAVAELNAAGNQPHITTVVIHTDPDARAWYVRAADEAVSLGPATYVDPADGHQESRCLDEEKVVKALREAQVDAAWPGWGFVAESASFAQRCEGAGIVVVGPGSETIRLLGDKVAAKRLAEQAGVPVVPWSGGPVDSAEHAVEIARRIGYPVIIKAAAGGGGRGIRIVGDPADLAAAFESASTEAELAFGDATLFIEQLVPAARHVEVQVVADGQGTVWTLGVRDCSIQRRHQKVIEESASTALSAAVEQEIRQAAVALVTAAGYQNAGTVEFLVEPDGASFMFMEVNTRLQVEHPVTEMTTGADLVKLQLHIAAGGRLLGPPPAASGHAIEARLCAEDPRRSFRSDRDDHRSRSGQAPAAHRGRRSASWPPACGVRARHRGAAMRGGPRPQLRARAGTDCRPRAAHRHGHPGGHWGARRRCGIPRFRLDDREDHRLGGGPQRGASAPAPGAGPDHGGDQGRDDQPLVPAYPARPARGAGRECGQPVAGQAGRGRRPSACG